MKTSSTDESIGSAAARTGLSEGEAQILKAVKSIAYGSVEIVVHDGRVVQIERREKVRLDK